MPTAHHDEPVAPRRRQQRRPIEDWRPVILDGAMGIIHRAGARALSMERLARAVGLAKPRIYVAFPGVEDVLSELYDRETAFVRTQFNALLAGVHFDGDADAAHLNAAIQLFIAGLLQSAQDHPDAWRLMMITGSDAPQILVQRNARTREWARRHLTAFLKTASIASPALATLDAELGARAMVVLSEDAIRLTMADPVEYNPARFQALAQWMFTAINPTPAAST
jgi:AcrR family transcriptional regulator